MPGVDTERFFKASEYVIIAAGALLLANVAIIATTGDFTVWWGTKMLYVAGALLFIFNR